MIYNDIMPITPINYANTIIYRIFSDNCDYVYVGSTTDITRRKAHHKKRCNIETNPSHNLKVYEMIRENGGWDNFKMLEIEEYSCESSKQARKREQYWIDFYKANLNSNKAFAAETKEEYNKQYNKQYKQKHKEELSQKITCECGAIISKSYTIQHKKRQIHLDAL